MWASICIVSFKLVYIIFYEFRQKWKIAMDGRISRGRYACENEKKIGIMCPFLVDQCQIHILSEFS